MAIVARPRFIAAFWVMFMRTVATRAHEPERIKRCCLLMVAAMTLFSYCDARIGIAVGAPQCTTSGGNYDAASCTACPGFAWINGACVGTPAPSGAAARGINGACVGTPAPSGAAGANAQCSDPAAISSETICTACPGLVWSSGAASTGNAQCSNPAAISSKSMCAACPGLVWSNGACQHGPPLIPGENTYVGAGSNVSSCAADPGLWQSQSSCAACPGLVWSNGTCTKPQCSAGLVLRGAYANDAVCVTRAIQAQTAADNGAQPSRVKPDGTCVQGYVWRQAIPSDHVCVPPTTRKQAQSENKTASVGAAKATKVEGTSKTSVEGDKATKVKGSSKTSVEGDKATTILPKSSPPPRIRVTPPKLTVSKPPPKSPARTKDKGKR